MAKAISIPADIARFIRYEPETGNLYWIEMPAVKGADRRGDKIVSRRSGYLSVKFLGGLLYRVPIALR